MQSLLLVLGSWVVTSAAAAAPTGNLDLICEGQTRSRTTYGMGQAMPVERTAPFRARLRIDFTRRTWRVDEGPELPLASPVVASPNEVVLAHVPPRQEIRGPYQTIVFSPASMLLRHQESTGDDPMTGGTTTSTEATCRHA